MKENHSNLVYLDTNVYSLLAKERSLRYRLTRLLIDTGPPGQATPIGFSETNMLELQRASRIHADISELMQFYPVVLFKPSAHIVNEQVASYPHTWTGNPILFSLAFTGTEGPNLQQILSHPRVAEIAADMARHAADVPGRHASLLPNFPPAQSGNYERGQAEEFARLLTIQWLVSSNTDFMRGLDGPLLVERFPGVLMHAYLMFWRFYLGRRTPNATSDLGDQSHARFYPYCSILVVEVDDANTLRQIQQHTDLLDGVRIMTIRDLRAWPIPDAPESP